MAAEGRTVIFISHKLNEVKAVADRVTVLRGGRSIATVDTAGATPRELAALMVGRAGRARGPRRARGAARRRRRARGRGPARARRPRRATPSRASRSSVRHGEIVGVAGVAGNGQRELAEAITGIRPPAAGAVLVDGRKLRASDPRSAIAAGVAHVPEDRLGTGRRAQPQHLRERGAQVVPRRNRLVGPDRPLAQRAPARARPDPPLLGRDAGPAPAGRATSPAGTSRSSCSAASSRASRRC